MPPRVNIIHTNPSIVHVTVDRTLTSTLLLFTSQQVIWSPSSSNSEMSCFKHEIQASSKTFKPPLAKCLQDGLNLMSHQEWQDWNYEQYKVPFLPHVPDVKWLCLDWKDNFGHVWRLESKKNWWTLSCLTMFCLNGTIYFENKRKKCIAIVVSRDMYYTYEILERCFGKIIKLNQTNERKTLEDKVN